jgi:SHS2 domain-containing protein
MGKVQHPPYETFEHGADIGVRGRGGTMAEAFENGAAAMFSLMVADLDSVVRKTETEISCESFDTEGLFTAWLNALLAEADLQRMLFRNFQVTIEGQRLRALVKGEPFDPSRHERGVEVKGATFTELAVREENGEWIAQCVVDV